MARERQEGARRAGRGSRARAATLSVALSVATVALAATAHAQLGETTAPLSEPGETTGVDTDVTPVAKDSPFFTRVAGALHNRTSVPADSVTPFDLDFFTVAFRNTRTGFAAGAECETDLPTPAEVKTCRRVPVIYRYFDPQNAPAYWEEIYRGQGEGYVGKIAFTAAGQAVAVGGTGKYPRREVTETGPDATYEKRVEDDAERGAGMARAWVLGPAGWSEITSQLPQGMRGLSALDFHPKFDIGFAGGLGQIWEWKGGGFSGKVFERPLAVEPALETSRRGTRVALFEFRVRELRFLTSADRTQAVAVTAGCCGEGEATNTPRVLFYDGDRQPEPSWFVRRLDYDPTDYDPQFGIHDLDPTDGTGPHRKVNQHPWLADSIYSFMVRPQGNLGNFNMSATFTPGGQSAEGSERPSVITDNQTIVNREGKATFTVSGFNFFRAPRGLAPGGAGQSLSASTARLNAGDGDGEPPPGGSDSMPGNAVPDWAVGELRSTDTGLGGRALAVSTRADLRPKPEDSLKVDAIKGDAELDQDKAKASLAARSYSLPTYALNAVDVVGLSGQGWAAGDHGALVRLGEGATLSGSASPEPPPPRLGSARPAQLGDGAAYGSHGPRTAVGSAGAVPSRASASRAELGEPRWTAWGSPDSTEAIRTQPPEDVRQIVISRDGSEGWAIGPSTSLPTGEGSIMSLYRYEGSEWKKCDPEGIRRQLDPDPECEQLASLLPRRSDGMRVRLLAAARVPLENDDVPTNDDDFEVVAVGTPYKQGEGTQLPGAQGNHLPVILRFRKGRWQLEEEAARDLVRLQGTDDGLQGVAFTAPDDGWAISRNNRIFHFGGETWVECSVAEPPARCGDPQRRLVSTPQASLTISSLIASGARVYLGGTRTVGAAGSVGFTATYPVILHREAGGAWGSADGGLDPGFGKSPASLDPESLAAEEATEQGGVAALAISRRPDGSFEGWAYGSFGGAGGEISVGVAASARRNVTALARLEPGGRWTPWGEKDASADYLKPVARQSLGEESGGAVNSPRIVVVPSADGGAGRAYLARRNSTTLIGFNPARERWQPVPVGASWSGAEDGRIQALVADGEGGAWAAVGAGEEFEASLGESDPYFYRLTSRPPREPFTEVAHPIAAGSITTLAGAPGGELWVGTNSDRLYRYDRVVGWGQVRIPGWDPGRVVTNPSPVNAVAIGPDGEGVAVGRGGRIARIDPEGVRLDPAAGTLCDLAAPVAPCGTGRNLRSAAVAPDGSALVGGDARTLLWRPAGGEFRAVTRPQAALAATITGISLPVPERAFLALDTGQVYAGQLAGGDWDWQVENETADGDVLALDSARNLIALRAIAVDAAGRGYAVGDRGLVLERTGDGARPWRRLDPDFSYELTSVALPAGGGEGALIGGHHGLLVTASGERLDIAHAADPYRPASGDVVGLALAPGYAAGEIEAWAGLGKPRRSDRRGSAQLLHYTSNQAEPLLDPRRRAEPLPDAPQPLPGEISLAAFGNSSCRPGSSVGCPEMTGSGNLNERIAQRVVDELAAGSSAVSGPSLAVFTGDVSDSAGWTGTTIAKRAVGPLDAHRGRILARTYGAVKHSRWSELVADRLEDGGIPLLGAIGSGDLAETTACDVLVTGQCPSTREQAKSGENLAWREAMEGRLAPWGLEEDEGEGRYLIEPVEGSGDAGMRELDLDGEGPAPGLDPDGGAARTHYAVDLVEREGGEAVARLVFADNSLRSLQASDPIQQPLERDGQLAWLERMICREGRSVAGAKCTRGARQPAVVVANTPTYSYGPGTGTDTALDGAVFEVLLREHEVSVVVSGRLGWNGLYWTRAPGVHFPDPGGEYPEAPPEALPGQGPPTPHVVASGAGGRFGPNGGESGEASEGYWHGYSVIRLHPSGDPTKTIVEQRPVYDWVGLVAQRNVVRPRQRLQLGGFGRAPLATEPGGPDAFNFIDSPAITHRYDLLAADPERPYLPLEDSAAGAAADGPGACGRYVCLPADVAGVDPQSGEVRAGAGRHSGAYAIAMLSVGEHVATYPLRFDSSPAFRAAPVVPQSPPAPSVPIASPTNPSTPVSPQIPSVSFPAPPNVPAIVPPPPAPPATPPSPPVPPPVPPADTGLSPLSLSFAPTGLIVAPTTSVIPPPAPPINPAPPGGARKEARQRQAASQSSGADAPESQGSDGQAADMADSPPSAHGTSNATRHEALARSRSKPEPSFTPLARASDGPGGSAALYGGGITLMALALALGFTTLRPTPRRRTPEIPAPAFSRARHRRR